MTCAGRSLPAMTSCGSSTTSAKLDRVDDALSALQEWSEQHPDLVPLAHARRLTLQLEHGRIEEVRRAAEADDHTAAVDCAHTGEAANRSLTLSDPASGFAAWRASRRSLNITVSDE